MAGKARDLITDEVRHLIRSLTGFQDDEVNFQLCVKYASSNLHYHRFLSVDSHAVRRSVFGIVTKFRIHGLLNASRKLDELVNRFLDNRVFVDHFQYDLQWSLLSLLLNLANNPTSHITELQPAPAMEEGTEKDHFDLEAYSDLCKLVRDSKAVFNQDFSDTESEAFSCLSDVEQVDEKELPVPTDICVEDPLVENELARCNSLARLSRREVIKNIFLADIWLKDNIQNSWWNDLDITESVSSKFPTAHLAFQWDEVCEQSSDIKTSTISEYKIIREILWVLQCVSSTFLFREKEGRFIVGPHISISSLTKDVIKSYLDHLCWYFNMIYALQKFYNEIFPNGNPEALSTSERYPPHTFEAYAEAMNDYLRELRDQAINIERKVKKQDDIHTLYSVSVELKPKMLQMQAIYQVHIFAVQNWKDKNNWEAASRLLSVLYADAVNSANEGHCATMMNLFLRSFKPYLDIIDTWLTDGRLEDDRNEFIIAKNSDVADSCQDLWEEYFLVHPYVELLSKSNIDALPLMLALQRKVLHAGKSMVLLRQLNRLPELRRKSERGGCIYKEFIEDLEGELSLFVIDINESEVVIKETLPSSSSQVTLTSKESIAMHNDTVNQLNQLDDPFLVEAFDTYVPIKARITDSVTNEDIQDDDTLFKRLSIHLKSGQLPVKPIMERILTRLIDEKHRAACLLLKTIFLKEYQLPMHLTVIRAVFLMEAGDVMHKFTTNIFQEAEENICWENTYGLTIQLEDCVDMCFPEYSSRFSIVNRTAEIPPGILTSLDDIIVKYFVEWPLTLILSPSNMEYYNAIFQFLLKVKRALWALQKLSFSDLEDRKALMNVDQRKCVKLNLVKLLRFWLLHSVGCVHSYLMGQVLHSLGLQLEYNIFGARDLDNLVQVHNAYVRKVHARCLQPRNSDVLKTAILQLVGLSLQLRDVWLFGVNSVTESKLTDMGEMYIKCHCFLGSVLQNCVEGGQDPHLAGLSVAISSSLPI